jgi:cytochrome c5
MNDRAFLKHFSGLVGILVLLAIVLFAVAQIVARKPVTEDAQAVAERIKPVGEVYVANATPAKPSPAAGAVAPAVKEASPATTPNSVGAGAGKALFEQVCQACHATGVAGAPKFGDKKAWAPRIAQGMSVLYSHALHGFHGKSGVMPPRGGSNASDAQVKAAVNYMVSAAK